MKPKKQIRLFVTYLTLIHKLSFIVLATWCGQAFADGAFTQSDMKSLRSISRTILKNQAATKREIRKSMQREREHVQEIYNLLEGLEKQVRPELMPMIVWSSGKETTSRAIPITALTPELYIHQEGTLSADRAGPEAAVPQQSEQRQGKARKRKRQAMTPERRARMIQATKDVRNGIKEKSKQIRELRVSRSQVDKGSKDKRPADAQRHRGRHLYMVNRDDRIITNLRQIEEELDNMHQQDKINIKKIRELKERVKIKPRTVTAKVTNPTIITITKHRRAAQ